MTPTAFGPRSLAIAGPNDDPRWRRAERKHGSQAAVENGPAASELRRRCVLLHHGLDPLDPPNTSMWRDGLRPVASSPQIVTPPARKSDNDVELDTPSPIQVSTLRL